MPAALSTPAGDGPDGHKRRERLWRAGSLTTAAPGPLEDPAISATADLCPLRCTVPAQRAVPDRSRDGSVPRSRSNRRAVQCPIPLTDRPRGSWNTAVIVVQLRANAAFPQAPRRREGTLGKQTRGEYARSSRLYRCPRLPRLRSRPDGAALAAPLLALALAACQTLQAPPERPLGLELDASIQTLASPTENERTRSRAAADYRRLAVEHLPRLLKDAAVKRSQGTSVRSTTNNGCARGHACKRPRPSREAMSMTPRG